MSQVITEYHIVTKQSADELAIAVNHRISAGWQPWGQMTATHSWVTPSDWSSSPWIGNALYVQPMVKLEPDPEAMKMAGPRA